jgi:2-amino-4-hydroxy-6-hydroxymethyldihydropteridine diphosphokinase
MALIALGSNLGDRRAMLDDAVAALSATPGIAIRAVSSYHETAPVGGPPGQAAFLNAAADIETLLEPGDLLQTLQRIENAAGRTREAHWGARTLDLDLLLYGDRVIRGPGPGAHELVVPHPRMAVRRFVLAPLAEIAPNNRHPLTGRTVAELLANLDRRPSVLALDLAPADWVESPQFGDAIVRSLAAELPAETALLGRGQRSFEFGPPWEDLTQRFSAWLDKLFETLDASRWTIARMGERWLVTDIWFDAAIDSAPHVTDGQEWALLRERLDRDRTTIVEPTFAVVPFRAPQTFARTPVLDLEGDEPEAIVEEILAACAATRA